MTLLDFLKVKLEPEEYFTPIQQALIDILKKNGPTTRSKIVKELNIPRTTIYDNLLKLQNRKLVEKISRNNGKRGRPFVFWELTEK